MTKMLPRIERQHIKGCEALRCVRGGTWKSPWCIGEHVFLTKHGTGGGPTRRGAGRSWVRFRCNHTKCDATIVIPVESILATFAPKGHERP